MYNPNHIFSTIFLKCLRVLMKIYLKQIQNSKVYSISWRREKKKKKELLECEKGFI